MSLPAQTLISLCLVGIFGMAEDLPITITPGPTAHHLFKGDRTQRLSADFLITNGSKQLVDLESVRMAVYDPKGRLIASRAVDGMGMCPSIKTLPHAEIAAGATVVAFNPWQELPPFWDLGRVRFTFTFSPRGSDAQTKISVAIQPTPVPVKTALRLPIAGRVIVRDGYDLYSHHRRVDMAHPFIQQLGMTQNPNRFGVDFMIVDEQDATFQGKGDRNEDYYVYAKPVLAPAAGTVVDCMDGRPDNPIGKFGIDYAELMRTKDRRLLGGNFVVVDHGNREFSFFAHLKPGSLKVKIGDTVAAGTELAAVGNSGDSFEPHLHYQLQREPTVGGETLMPRFHRFIRHLGSRSEPCDHGEVDTGDVVEAKK